MFKCFLILSNLKSIESSVTFHWSILLIRWLSFCLMVLIKVMISLVKLIDKLVVFVLELVLVLLLAVAFPLFERLLRACTELLSPLGPLLSVLAYEPADFLD